MIMNLWTITTNINCKNNKIINLKKKTDFNFQDKFKLIILEVLVYLLLFVSMYDFVIDNEQNVVQEMLIDRIHY